MQHQVTSSLTVDQLLRQQEDDGETAIWTVFRKMLFFTVMMTVAPLSSFFLSKYYIFEGIFDMSNRTSYIYAVVVAVLVVHAILVAFIVVAFREDISGKKTVDEAKKLATGKKD